ncbi:multidrug resistance protein [Paenibacillus marchantiophytorum]|uniref:Multidrug resistance protein n=1 Tax=Paenibacillus marchantiophytorum TaxID=1619310 RepID=A0ABQ1FGD9_9BACL|nr:MFS transporter [Paenibacillus marchantiophytorum]GGA11995.1 multidrug resistance protein [Paenibacillus marchantiophytorum]
MGNSNKKELLSIASIPLIMTLGNSMLIPVLPAIRSKLGVTSLQVSLLITVYSAVAILLIPIAGYLSDKYGRKFVIIPSLLITGIGGLIAGLAAWWMDHSYVVMLIGRFVQGVGAAGAFPIVIPLVGDLFKKDSDVSSGLGLVETANTFGKVLSPILGSALSMVVWFLPFMFIPVLCVISMLLVLFMVKPPTKSSKPTKSISFSDYLAQIKTIFKNNGRWLYAIFAIGCVCMLVIFGVLTYLSDLLEEKAHVYGIVKGCLLAIPLAALCIASYVTGKVIGKNQLLMKWLIVAGLLLLAGSLLVCGLVGSTFLLLVFISLAGIGIGAALPCLDVMITEGIPKEERGTITSIYSSMRFIGVAIGPPLASILVKNSPSLMFYMIAGISILAGAIALFAIKPKKDEQAPLKRALA